MEKILGFILFDSYLLVMLYFPFTFSAYIYEESKVYVILFIWTDELPWYTSLSCMFKAFGCNLLEFLKGRVLICWQGFVSIIFVLLFFFCIAFVLCYHTLFLFLLSRHTLFRSKYMTHIIKHFLVRQTSLSSGTKSLILNLCRNVIYL